MGKLEISCPANPMDIQGITINGEDCGSVAGVTRIVFEVVPNSQPKLSIERCLLKDSLAPRLTEVKLLQEPGEPL